MTYCVAAVVDEGIVFASDSRTNAGVDHVATFCKMNVFEVPDERVVVVLTAGNLSVTQSVMSLLRQRARDEGGGEGPHAHAGILRAHNMYDVALAVGETLREVARRDGQIHGETPKLFHVYPEGNFIQAALETNYFQIGETKYGKPIIDRVVRHDTALKDAAKCLLVSFDSTMRSNLSVGLPIDLLAYEKDALRVTLKRRFHEGDAYFRQISEFWSAGLRRVFREVPDLDWSP